jgi:replicative DNA helicase
MSLSHAGSRDVFVDMHDLMLNSMDKIEKAQVKKQSDSIDFGFVSLRNKMLIEGSKLIFIAGRPGMGKTAMMIALSKHIASQEIKTGVLTIEMDNEDLSYRMLSSESKINSLQFHMPVALNIDDFNLLNTSAQDLSCMPIVFNDSKANINDIVRRCRKMKNDGCKIIFIDQLSKISFDRRLSEYEGYTRNCGILAELKKELRIPIVVLCQLGRKVEDSSNKRPTLQHLKQTGQIEEDADMVFFIYRPGYYNLKNNAGHKFEKSFTEIILAKCRNGIPGSDFSSHFDDKRGFFELGVSINGNY